MGAGWRYYFDSANYRRCSGCCAKSRIRRGAKNVLRVPDRCADDRRDPCHLLRAGSHSVPSLRRTQVREPTFCVGHARSGTTYLHRLMAKDPQFSLRAYVRDALPVASREASPTALFRIDDVTGKRLRRRLDAIEESAFAETNDMHKTGFFAPEEDDFLLTWSLGSGFWIVMFPYMGELDFYHVDRWSEDKRRRVMTFYRECVRRQIVLNGEEST